MSCLPYTPALHPACMIAICTAYIYPQQEEIIIVLLPDRIFRARRKNGYGELPIPFSFICAGMLAHCSFLI